MPPLSPDPDVVLDLLEAFRRSKVMFAGVQLGVFDALARGPQSLAQLAAALRCTEDGLERLLNACVCLKLLERAGTDYANTDAAAAYLCGTSPQRLTGYIRYSNDVMWKLWSHLEDAVREGTHRWPQAYGWDTPIFANFFRTEEAMREFLLGMHGFGLLSSPPVVAAFDLGGFRRLVDLGGATGHLAVAACERYPELRAVLFDLPAALPLAREMLASVSVAERIELVAGDFFADPLPAGDLYAVGRILHDWSEPKILQLLQRVYETLPPHGALLIAEKLLDEDKAAPRWAHMQNLNMLTCTEGKERTLSEYESLLRQVGFRDIQGSRTQAPLDVILAKRLP